MKRQFSCYLLPLIFVLSASTASAQFFYFGRNKVQYTDFEWHVLRTEHFDIYYYPEMKELAERGAFFAEESYKLLEVKFNHTLNKRVPLIFYSSHLHFQQTNTTRGFIPEGVGGFFEFLKGRVVIPSDGSTAQFRHVIRHELVHVFMHSKISRVLIDHRKGIAESNFEYDQRTQNGNCCGNHYTHRDSDCDCIQEWHIVVSVV